VLVRDVPDVGVVTGLAGHPSGGAGGYHPEGKPTISDGQSRVRGPLNLPTERIRAPGAVCLLWDDGQSHRPRVLWAVRAVSRAGPRGDV